jgi:Mrp family chromosome partitioning ATPase
MAVADESARTLSDYVALIRRRLWLTAVVALASVGAAGAYTLHQPTLYRAEMKVVIGQQGGAFQLNVGNVADQFTQTMSDLIQSDVVASRVIDRLLLDQRPADLLAHLAVRTKPSTSVMSVSFDDADAARGIRVLTAVGDVFTELVAERLAVPADLKDQNVTVSATVFDPAHLLPGKVQPRPVRTLAVAGILGILLGLLAAVVREQFDDTIRNVDQAERAFGQTATVALAPNIVGFHPFDRSPKRRHDPVLTELAVQKLRAGVLWSPDGSEARTIVVTSANPEEGKTTVASNLAMVMTAQGATVIVVEADLRHPTMHRFLGMPEATSAPGLDRVMSGATNSSDALLDIPVPARLFAPFEHGRVSWMSSGAAPDAPGRLRAMLGPPADGQSFEFGLARTVEVLEELRSRADYVIVDTPPILLVPDAYPFVAAADIVLAVVRSGRTSARAVEALARTLRRLRARRVELVVTEADDGFGQPYHYAPRPQGKADARTAVRPEVIASNGQPRRR